MEAFNDSTDFEDPAPLQWPQHHRIDASPSNTLQDGFAAWPARTHCLHVFIDYVRVDPRINVDDVLENRAKAPHGGEVLGHPAALLRTAGQPKVPVGQQPASACHCYVNGKPSWPWKTALVVRSSIAFLESIKARVSALPTPRSAHFLQWTDKRHELAELSDEWAHCVPRATNLPAMHNC